MLVNNVPILEEWVTLPTAAQMLGVTKQTVHNMVAAGKFPSVHTISGTGKRNIYVVRRAEVFDVRAARQQATDEIIEGAAIPIPGESPAEKAKKNAEEARQGMSYLQLRGALHAGMASDDPYLEDSDG